MDFTVKILNEDEWCKDETGDDNESIDLLSPTGDSDDEVELSDILTKLDLSDELTSESSSRDLLSDESGKETLSEGCSRETLDDVTDEEFVSDEVAGSDEVTADEVAASSDAACAAFSYDAVNQRVSLTLKFPRTGLYRVKVTYKGESLMNGDFDCIVLTASAYATVLRGVGNGADQDNTRVMRFQARQGARRLALSLSARRVRVCELVLGVIPVRAAAFRVCRATRLLAGGRRGGTCSPPAGSLTLRDGEQPPLQLWLPRRDLLLAAYALLLAQDYGGDDSFASKQQWVYRSLRRLHGERGERGELGEHGEHRERDERGERSRPSLRLRVRRDDLVASSLKATKGFSTQHWCRDFHVSFVGEQGVDWGGVRREWFSLLCGQLFSARLGLFVPLGGGGGGGGGRVHPNPHRPPHLKLKHYELAGKVVGKCLYESALGAPYRQFVRAHFTRSFLAQLIGLRLDYHYFEHDDPELYMGKVQYVLREDLDSNGAELYFCDELYSGGQLVGTHDLLPGGSQLRVTNSTKRQYLSLLAAWRLGGAVRAER
ncbi:hypothetical protein ACJJTC_012385, partial [Scirpophaga incertulas]